MHSAEPTDHHAIATLYSEHHGWLQRWLHRKLGHSADAADLAHDAFLRVMLRPRAFDSFDGARAYLGTVARGLCIDLWRRREVEAAWLAALAARPELQEPSAEHRVAVLQALCEIDTMLGRLGPKVAQAFVLAMACEMTDREVAAELGVSDRMVRKYVARAMVACVALEARQMAGELAPSTQPACCL